MGKYQLYYMLLFLFCVSKISAQLCNNTTFVNAYRLVPESFRGTTSIEPTSPGCHLDGVRTVCDGATLLNDNMLGPEEPDINNSTHRRQFVAWRNDTINPYLAFELLSTENILLSAIDLYILNYPGQNIGLPKLSLYHTSMSSTVNPTDMGVMEIPFHILGNDQLSQNDSTRRKLTLRPRTPFSVTPRIEGILLRWDFTGVSNVEWFLLSEVKFCTDSQSNFLPSVVMFQAPAMDQIVQPSAEVFASQTLTLTCTVSLQGSYEWRWKRGSVILSGTSTHQQHEILSADGTRMSKLVLKQLNFLDADIYTCEATYVFPVSFRSRKFDLRFPTLIDAVPSTTGYLGGGSVELRCEVLGYAMTSDPPMWSSDDGADLTNTSKYMITTSDGANSLIYSDGSTGPSFVSILTIFLLDPGDRGNYTCTTQRNRTTIQLLINSGTASPTTTSPLTTTVFQNSRKSNQGGIVAGVIMGLLVIILFITIAIILIILYHHKQKHSSSSIVMRRKPSVNDSSSEMHQGLTKADIEWQIPHVQNETSTGVEIIGNGATNDVDLGNLYSTVIKVTPDPPPVPAQNFLETGFSDLPHMNIYEEAKPKRRMTNSSSPKLAKLKNSGAHVNLDQNPIYESTGKISTDSEKQLLVKEDGDDTVVYAQPMKRKTSAKNATTVTEAENDPIYSEALTPALFQQPASFSDVKLHPYGPIYAEPTTLKKAQNPIKMLDATCFKELRHIGLGQFGEVVLAETVGLSRSDLNLSPADNDQTVSIQVAIKKLRTDAENPVKENFEKEIKFMSRLKDSNIISLLAINKGGDPFIVMEYMENGDLHMFLEDFDSVVTDDSISQNQIPLSILVYMTVQIASGMKYLASHNYVHRDLATRNCLVGKDFTVKIADFGMSKNLYEQSYYKVRGRAMLPIRWMASESFFGRFSEKTDVWSYGVVMWEIFTLCKCQPYEEMEDQEIIQDAIKGDNRILLKRPEVCPEDVYSVMLRCWEYRIQERACFNEVFNSLSTIHRAM